MLAVPAYAKLNLALDLLGRRADGWHELDSVAVTIDWHDLLSLTLAPTSTGGTQLHCSGEIGNLPAPEENLVSRAFAAFARTADIKAEATIWLHKRIPAQAGLGGGSADAAAILRAGAQLFPDAVGKSDLEGIGFALGADIPSLLRGGANRMQGRGEIITAIGVANPLYFAVAVLAQISTAAAYAASRGQDFKDSGRCAALQQSLERGEWPHEDWLGSALEPAACRVSPELARNLQKLRSQSPYRWHLTGSGGAAFALFPGAAAAVAASRQAGELGFAARACRAVGLSP